MELTSEPATPERWDAGAVEGVPRDDLAGRRWPPPMAYTGMASMFVRAGFTEVARTRDRPVHRLVL